MSPLRRQLLKLAHSVHIYVTLFGLFLLLFFAVTGFMLNNEKWFIHAGKAPEVQSGHVPSEWLAKPDLRKHLDNPDAEPPPESDALLAVPDKLPIVELLRKDYRATGQVQDFNEREANEITVVFLGPGRRTEAVIQRKDGTAKISTASEGFSGLISDLHKGKSEGVVWSTGWSYVIDITCVLTIIMSITGVYLWWSLKSRGNYGTVVILAGIVATVAVYWFTVK